jgi:hypothetical protein
MNNAMRISLSAVFTSIATSYFLGMGIHRLAQMPSSHSSPAVSPPVGSVKPGTSIATAMVSGKIFFGL